MSSEQTYENKGIEALKADAEQGVVDAMYILGGCYAAGEGVEQDYEKARALWERGRAEGDGRVLSCLGLLYSNGWGVEVDFPCAVTLWEEGEQYRDADSIFALGILYEHGAVVDEDQGRSAKKFIAAVNEGFSTGNLMVAFGLKCLEPESTKNLRCIRRHAATKLLSKSCDKAPAESWWFGPMIEALPESKRQWKKGDDLLKAIPLLSDLHDEVRKLLKSKIFKADVKQVKSVAHFTRTGVVRLMLNTDKKDTNGVKALPNVLRFYNAVYANDPKEGWALVQYDKERKKRDDKKGNKSVGESFLAPFFKPEDGCLECPTPSTRYHSSMYTVSFTKESDHLTLWRAYGNNGDGCCVVFPASVFKGDVDSILKQVSQVGEATVAQSMALRDGENDSDKRDHLKAADMVLFKILYDRVEDGESNPGESPFAKVLDALKPHLEKLLAYAEDKPHVEKPLRESVQAILALILYLCKDKAYQEEQEYRVLVPSSVGGDWVKLDEGTRESGTPHAYIESEPFMFDEEGYKIIVGPRVPDRAAVVVEFNVRLAQAVKKAKDEGTDKGKNWDKNVEVEHSKIEYR